VDCQIPHHARFDVVAWPRPEQLLREGRQLLDNARSGRRKVTSADDAAPHTGARRATPVTSSNNFKKE